MFKWKRTVFYITNYILVLKYLFNKIDLEAYFEYM